jgi:hypothetical protein
MKLAAIVLGAWFLASAGLGVLWARAHHVRQLRHAQRMPRPRQPQPQPVLVEQERSEGTAG